MNHLEDVNEVTRGRTWADGDRDWVRADAYGVVEGDVTWVLSQDGKEVGRVSCVDYPWGRCVREAPEGLILEFGVREGASLRQIAKVTERKVYGFDCWRGLPHSDGGFTKGDCIAAKPTDLPGNVELVDGLFSDTLEEFLDAHPGPVAFANLDCDLYCGTAYVLHCLMGRFVTGSIIALSDIAFSPDAQRRAWRRYLSTAGQNWIGIGKNHLWGEVYRLVDSAHK